MKILILILGIFLVFLPADFSNAEKDREESAEFSTFGPSGYDRLNSLKANIATLLEENRKLEAEYALIQRELDGAEATTGALRDEVSAMIGQSVQSKKEAFEKQQSYQTLQGRAVALGDEILLWESKNAFVEGELIDLEDKQRIRELQLADLQYAKKEVEMELKLKVFKQKESVRSYEEQVLELEMQLRQNLEKEQELSSLVARLEKERESAPKRLDELQREIMQYKAELSQLETEKRLKQQETNLLKSKKLLATRTFETHVWEKEQERLMLKNKVQDLERDFNKLNRELEVSLSRKNQKNELMKDVISIDKENQQLREQISELKEQRDLLQ